MCLNARGFCEKSKAAYEVVGAHVGRAAARPWDAERLLREGQQTAELVLYVRNVTVLRVRRDDDQRHAEAELYRFSIGGAT